MNKPIANESLASSRTIDLRSSELDNLLSQIAQDESERERERVLPLRRD